MTERIRGFTDEEAALILRHAAKEKDPVRRWVPLLCAYSGARLSEVCQLRVEDVFQRGGVWCMKFDPEAGSLKNENSERAVPLHPAIVERGFLQQPPRSCGLRRSTPRTRGVRHVAPLAADQATSRPFDQLDPNVFSYAPSQSPKWALRRSIESALAAAIGMMD
jgi:integrase